MKTKDIEINLDKVKTKIQTTATTNKCTRYCGKHIIHLGKENYLK